MTLPPSAALDLSPILFHPGRQPCSYTNEFLSQTLIPRETDLILPIFKLPAFRKALVLKIQMWPQLFLMAPGRQMRRPRDVRLPARAFPGLGSADSPTVSFAAGAGGSVYSDHWPLGRVPLDVDSRVSYTSCHPEKVLAYCWAVTGSSDGGDGSARMLPVQCPHGLCPVTAFGSC